MKLIKSVILAVVVIELLAVSVPIITANITDPELDVFVVAGQSNTYPKNNTNPSTATPIPDEGRAYYFGTETDPTYNKSMDLSACQMYDLNNEGTARIGGLFPTFAAEYTTKTNHDVYLIDTGLSGQPIATFLPGGHNYDWPSQVIDEAMKAIPSEYKVNVRGYIWIQGEGDASTPAQSYEIKMIQLYDLYSDGGLPVDLPTCYICKVRDAQGGNAATAQTWLVDNHVNGFVMASTLPDTFTTENGLLGSDALHYTQAGFNALGVDLANNIPPLSDEAPDYTNLMLLFVPLSLIALVIVFVKVGHKD